MKKIKAILRLSRVKEYTFFVTITTLLGIASAGGQFGWQFVGVWLANWLAVMFAFMINDVEDAEDDALNPRKVNRNPVSAGLLSPRAAYTASFIVAVAAGAVYYSLGTWPFALGAISLVLGFIYSWRKIRLKNIAFLDFISHCMMLAGLQFLPGYLAFENRPPTLEWLYPFFFVVGISLYGELFNELRDLDGDLKAGLRHTAAVIGPRATYWLMMSALTVGIFCGGMTFFWLKIIPTWVMIVMVGAAAGLIILPAYRARRLRSLLAVQESFQKPLEAAAALALGFQFAAPWAWAFVAPWAWAFVAPWAQWLLKLKFF